MKKTALFLVVALIFILGTGCAATKQAVSIPNLDQPFGNSQNGRIYVVRPSGLGSAISMRITDNGQYIGSTGPGGFLCWDRDPGQAEIIGKAENTSKVSLNVNEGKVYYILQHVQMGLFFARNKLEVVNEQEGKRNLQKCKPPVAAK